MTRKKVTRTPEQIAAWKHGGIIGDCWMARRAAERVAKGITASDESRHLADQIVNLTYQLAESLKTRR